MTDREMLELAAVAIGLENLYWGDVSTENLLDHLVISTHEDGRVTTHKWNPIKDDGDALRLAAKLRLDIKFYETSVTVVAEAHGELEWYELYDSCGNPEAACRLAILRVAAEIGRSMSNE